MLNTAGSSRLALESLDGGRIGIAIAVKEFDSYRALHKNMGRAVDCSHAAFADLTFNPVLALKKSANKRVYCFRLEQSASCVLQRFGTLFSCFWRLCARDGSLPLHFVNI